MLLSRREALAGSAAVASMLIAPAARALPTLPDGPVSLRELVSASRPRFIVSPASLICRPFAVVSTYRDDFRDGRIHHDGEAGALNTLAWVYETANDFESPFRMQDAWKLFAAVNDPDHAEAKHREHLATLMRDKRTAFFLPDRMAEDFGVDGSECVLFERDGDWISFTSFNASRCWMDDKHSGKFQINRRAGLVS